MFRAAIIVFALAACSQQAAPPPEKPVAAAVTPDSVEPVASRTLLPAADITEDSRVYLATRMKHHGRHATDLLFAVVLMDHEGTQRIAKRIATKPPASPYNLAGEEQLRKEFPETFFDLEAELESTAQRLAADAKAKDSTAIAADYSKLVGTCVECHTLFTRRQK
jgi:hypothetical protein